MATTKNITYNQLKDLFQDFQTRHYQLNDYYFGELSEFGNSKSFTYPLLGVIPSQSVLIKGQGGNYNTIQHIFNIFVADLVKSDELNTQDVLSDTLQIITDLVGEIDQLEFYRENNITMITDSVLTPFFERFDDLVGGWNIQITLSMPNKLNPCLSPIETKPNIEITGVC